MLSDKSEMCLASMRLVETFSTMLNTTSWIWGGFTVDIHKGRILREHEDLDYLTKDLHTLIPRFTELFEGKGWQVKELDNGDLKLRRNRIKIQLGHVEITNEAKWTHNGEKGYICFPTDWLNPGLVRFYNVELHVVEPEFQYVMKEHPEMLNPDWIPRDKDILAKQQIREILEERGIDLGALYSLVTDVRSR